MVCLYALTVLATSSTLSFVVSDTIGIHWLGHVTFVLVMTGVVGLPVAVGIAILKYRLYEINLLINRTLVYSSLTTMLALVYFGGVAKVTEVIEVISKRRLVGLVLIKLSPPYTSDALLFSLIVGSELIRRRHPIKESAQPSPVDLKCELEEVFLQHGVLQRTRIHWLVARILV